METHQQMVADKLTVGQLMTTCLLALPPLVPVHQLVTTLRTATHHSFPVTTEVETAMRSQDDFELQVPGFGALLNHGPEKLGLCGVRARGLHPRCCRTHLHCSSILCSQLLDCVAKQTVIALKANGSQLGWYVSNALQPLSALTGSPFKVPQQICACIDFHQINRVSFGIASIDYGHGISEPAGVSGGGDTWRAAGAAQVEDSHALPPPRRAGTPFSTAL